MAKFFQRKKRGNTSTKPPLEEEDKSTDRAGGANATKAPTEIMTS